MLNLEEMVEEESLSLLEQFASSLAYCTNILHNLEDESADEEDKDLVNVFDSLLSPEVCDDIASTKKNLLPLLDHVANQEPKQKKTWGLVVATRMSTRNQGNINIMDKAKEYQKKRNLEIPLSSKGNSFAALGSSLLCDMANSVGISIGSDITDRNDIIDNIVATEINRSLDFIEANPEIMLPVSEDIFHDQMFDHGSDFPPNWFCHGTSVT